MSKTKSLEIKRRNRECEGEEQTDRRGNDGSESWGGKTGENERRERGGGGEKDRGMKALENDRAGAIRWKASGCVPREGAEGEFQPMGKQVTRTVVPVVQPGQSTQAGFSVRMVYNGLTDRSP